MTTFHDGDLSIALRRMAKRSRDEAQVLLDEAGRLERAAAIIDKQKYETVPLAAVRDAVQIDLEEAIAAKTRAPKERRPSPVIQAKMRALLHEAGPLSATGFSARVGVSQVHFYLALRPLLASGEIVRDGPKNGPGATYRLATTRKDGDAHAEQAPARATHTTAPAEIPPAAPTCEMCGRPRHSGSARLCRECYRKGVDACAREIADKPAAPPPVARDHVRAPALTREGKVRKKQPRTVAEIIDGHEPTGTKIVLNSCPAAPTIPGQIVLDMLREAGAAGEKPSRLRVECGLEPAIFRVLMQTLMEAGVVVRERDADGPVESVRYRLKEHAQRALAKAAPVALDGRDEEHRP